MSILLVEDDPNIQKLVSLHLQRENLQVVSCASGEEALELFSAQKSKTPFDLVILDWMIQGKLSGLDLCKKFAGLAAILMLTSRSSPTDIILGLEMGADDYITKPFEIPIFVARVRALLRRAEKKQSTEQFVSGSLKIDFSKLEVKCGEEEIKLTASEFKILAALARHQGRVFPREQLLKEVQDEGVTVVDRVIDTHVYTIRRKLGACADFIETIRGIGYRIK